jgi:hypothetical protein
MNRRIILSLAIAGLTGLFVTGMAAAQEKQRVSFKTLPENFKYTQQLFIDVGDAPGHQVRVYENRTTFPSNSPVFNGVKLQEIWGRATSDYTDNNGPGTGYAVFVFENGDKFFSRWSLVAQRDGTGKAAFTLVGPITGGTGKLAGIRGLIRQAGTADPKAGFNDNQTDIEYWMEK